MQTLSTDAAAAALGIDRKTLDNVLAREARNLVRPGKRGRRRKLSIAVLERIAIALIISRDLGTSIARALTLADSLIKSPSAPVVVGTLCQLTFDVPRLRGALAAAVGDALESVAEPTRGRPRG